MAKQGEHSLPRLWSTGKVLGGGVSKGLTRPPVGERPLPEATDMTLAHVPCHFPESPLSPPPTLGVRGGRESGVEGSFVAEKWPSSRVAPLSTVCLCTHVR